MAATVWAASDSKRPRSTSVPCGGACGVRSEAAPVEVDGVVDADTVPLGEERRGDLGFELDTGDSLECGTIGQLPTDVQRYPLPALPSPEPLDGARVVGRQGPPEPPSEGRAGRVVVENERRAAAAHDAGQLGEPGLAPRPEEVGPARLSDADRRVRHRQRLGRPPTHLDPVPLGSDPLSRTPYERCMRLDADDGRRGVREAR